MLANIAFSLNIVAPMIVFALIGYILRRLNILNETFLPQCNKIIFNICVPATLIRSIYAADIGEVFDIRFILFVSLWTLISFCAVWFLSTLLVKDRSVISAFVQGSCRSNVGALAVPLAFSILGEGAARSALALAIIIPAYNILCIILLTTYSQDDGNAKNFKEILLSIIKNPSIISIALSIVLSVSFISLPAFAFSSIESLAQITMPLVLICLGANMILTIDRKLKYAIVASIIKVVAMPLAVIAIAYLFGFRGNDLVILMLLNGVATAPAGYVMVVALGGDADVSAKCIALTTILSTLTLAIFIFAFTTQGVISV